MTPLKLTFEFLKVKNFKNVNITDGRPLVLGMASGEQACEPVKSIKANKELDALFASLKGHKGFAGKVGQTLSLYSQSHTFQGIAAYGHLLSLGVGESKHLHSQSALQWGGKLSKLIRDSKANHVDVFVDSFYQPAVSANSKDAAKDFAGRPLASGIPSFEDFVEKLALGIVLGAYEFTKYKSKKKDAKKEDEKKVPVVRLLSTTLDDRKVSKIIERVGILAESVYLTRDLQNTPAGDMVPADIARAAQDAGKKSGFHVEVWDEKKIKAEGMGGIIAVGQGSDSPPRFIIMEVNASKKNVPTVVLIGKGVSFDTGGICIKPAAGMEEMKMDMSGAASVIGAMNAIAKLKVPYRVVGLVPSAENMINGSATRPGDVYTAHDGQTVEVINTDAEGRLVLADALSYAKKYNPTCVIDMATLTGAVVIALGAQATGMMGNDAELLKGFALASAKSGERVWELPLYPEYGEELKSKVADYRNVGNSREAGSQKGGQFLNFFVEQAYPWIHLDIAATADTPSGQGDHCPPHSGTGVPVRSVVEFVSNFDTYFKAPKKK